jgi:hypothetical protein
MPVATATATATATTIPIKEYTNAFISTCIILMNSIHQGKSFTKCLHILYYCAKEHQKEQQQLPPAQPTQALTAENWFEPLWFIYYMFYAIHNPKLEEYINRKHTAAAAAKQAASAPTPTTTTAIDAAHILKNMIRRRECTSTIVFQLFDYAFIKKHKATHVYMMPSPATAQKSETSPQSSHSHSRNEYQLCKSFLSGHLKTTASKIECLYRCFTPEIQSQMYQSFIETVMTSAAATATATAIDATTGTSPLAFYTDNSTKICEKMNNAKYKRKDIIFLSVVCYMKVREEDINMKSVFISLTEAETIVTTAEIEACITANDDDPHDPHDPQSSSPPTHPEYTERYDQLYKYLLS